MTLGPDRDPPDNAWGCLFMLILIGLFWFWFGYIIIGPNHGN